MKSKDITRALVTISELMSTSDLHPKNTIGSMFVIAGRVVQQLKVAEQVEAEAKLQAVIDMQSDVVEARMNGKRLRTAKHTHKLARDNGMSIPNVLSIDWE